MKKPYYFFEHTADVGIYCRGSNLKSLFSNVATALYELIFEREFAPIKLKKNHMIILNGSGLEDILAQWINEIIYLTFFKKMIFYKFEYSKLNKSRLEAKGFGENINREIKFQRELKGITYHNFILKRKNKFWETKFIIDV